MAPISKKRKGRIIAKERFPSNEPLSLTLIQAREMFLLAKKSEGLRHRTINDYISHHGYFVSWLQENYPNVSMIGDISAQVLREYVTYLSEAKQHYSGHPTKSKAEKDKYGLKPSTVNIRISTLRSFFNWLTKEQIIHINPAKHLKKQRVDEDSIGAFSDEQIDLLLDAPNQKTFTGFRDFVMMELFLQTGLRAGELVSLTEEDIDFKTRLIRLPGAKNKNRRYRVIPISTIMVRLLMELISENKRFFSGTEQIFLSNYGDPVTISNIADRIKNYGKMVGIYKEVRCSPHTFRHTFALNFLKSGADIIALQRILGHSSMDMVRKYVQHSTEDLMDAHNKFVEHRSRPRYVRRTNRT